MIFEGSNAGWGTLYRLDEAYYWLPWDEEYEYLATAKPLRELPPSRTRQGCCKITVPHIRYEIGEDEKTFWVTARWNFQGDPLPLK